jgi:integrase
MKGHIRKRSPGHWAIVLDQYDETGKRKRRWHSFEGTRKGAETHCAQLISAQTGGTYVEPTKMTLAEHFEVWLSAVKMHITPKTHERYTEICRKNIVPLLGKVVLSKLQPHRISQAYTKALESGRCDGKGGLSKRTVGHMHRVLKEALQQAVIWKHLAFNPCNGVKPPKAERHRFQTYDLAQTARLLDALCEDRMLIPVVLAVLCGLRRGEICGLQWVSVSLNQQQLAIVRSAEQTYTNEPYRGGKRKKTQVRYKPPKSGKGRTVALSETVIRALHEHRIAQAERLLRLGIRTTGETHVCTNDDGSPLRPHTLTHYLKRLAKNLGLPVIRFHDLRHACATHMLVLGINPKVASEKLGHSDVRITLDLYSHVLPGIQENAAALVDEQLRAEIDKAKANN